MNPSRIIGIGETVFDILFKNNQPQKAVPGSSTFNSIVSLDGKLPEMSKDDVVLFGSFFAINPAIRPVVGGLLRKAHEAGDNFNAGYIYAKMQGIDDQARRIAMAQRWSQDVCQQLVNNISDELVATLQNERI
jgi:hypothetical protein